MIRAALDANALLSGFVGRFHPTSAPGEVVRRWQASEFELVTSNHIIGEVTRALQKPYFQRAISTGDIADAIHLLATDATRVAITSQIRGVASHSEDDLVIATAVDGNVDYLVTGDAALLRLGSYRGVTIVSPRAFLDVLTDAQHDSASP